MSIEWENWKGTKANGNKTFTVEWATQQTVWKLYEFNHRNIKFFLVLCSMFSVQCGFAIRNSCKNLMRNNIYSPFWISCVNIVVSVSNWRIQLLWSIKPHIIRFQFGDDSVYVSCVEYLHWNARARLFTVHLYTHSSFIRMYPKISLIEI